MTGDLTAGGSGDRAGDRARDVADVEAANAALYAAVESADAAALADLWDELDPAAVACVHPGWPMLRGRSRVLRSFAAIMSGTPYIQFFLSDVAVRVLGDTAVVTCREDILTAVSVDEDGGAAVTTNVFVRRPDGWRLQAHHASPVLTAPDTAPDIAPDAAPDAT